MNYMWGRDIAEALSPIWSWYTHMDYAVVVGEGSILVFDDDAREAVVAAEPR